MLLPYDDRGLGPGNTFRPSEGSMTALSCKP